MLPSVTFSPDAGSKDNLRFSGCFQVVGASYLILGLGEIAENDYSLSVSSYVEPKDRREVIDIAELNQEIEAVNEIVKKLES